MRIFNLQCWFGFAIALALLISFVPAAHADGAAGCKNPGWAPQPMPGFAIDSCETKAWDSVSYDLTTGSNAVRGQRSSVEYALKEQNKNPTADAARDYFIAAGKKAGATLMSDPTDSWQATLKRTTAAGEFWYRYDHGSGSDTETDSYTLTTIKVAPVPQTVVAQAMAGPLDVADKHCVSPPWLKTQFAYFKVDSCERKIWDEVDFQLPDGTKTVAGKRLTVHYALADANQSPTALMAQKNYIAALEGIGAKLMSDPSDDSRAVLMQKTAAGEFWYKYEGTSGNAEETDAYALTTVQVAPPPQEVVAQRSKGSLSDQQGKGCKNPPWLLKQFTNFKLDECTKRDLDAITLDLPSGKKTLAGRFLEVNYVLADDEEEPTALYVQKNYINALEKIGAKLVSDPTDLGQAVLTQKTDAGELWYIYTQMSGNEEAIDAYALTALQIGGPPPKTCTIQVYGIQFDFDKSDIKPASEPVLNQVLAMFSADPSYSAEVGGHTDNVGKAAYNLALSERRAQAVQAWLVAHGVTASRLTSHGYGDTRPLVPNTSDANRAKNRRVELKKKDCK